MASNKTEIKFNTKKLDSLLTYLKSLDDYYVKVGIIGSKAKAQHKNTNLTNAELGAIHEFGKGYQPQRSFLEMPLKMKFNFNTNQNLKELKKKSFNLLFVKRKPREFFNALGQVAHDIIIGAFETNGYGAWKPWSKAYERRRISQVKGKRKRQEFWLNHNILTLTGQLRRSIAFKVMKKK